MDIASTGSKVTLEVYLLGFIFIYIYIYICGEGALVSNYRED